MKLLRCLITSYYEWSRYEVIGKLFTEQHHSKQSVVLITYNHCHLQQHRSFTVPECCEWTSPQSPRWQPPKAFLSQMLHNSLKGVKGQDEIWTNISSFFSARDLFSFCFQIRLIPFKIVCTVRYVPGTPNKFFKPFMFILKAYFILPL